MAEFHRGVRKQIQSHFWIYRVHQKKQKNIWNNTLQSATRGNLVGVATGIFYSGV